MNLRKKPFSISLQALAGVLIFSCLLAHPFSEAASSPPGDKCDYAWNVLKWLPDWPF